MLSQHGEPEVLLELAHPGLDLSFVTMLGFERHGIGGAIVEGCWHVALPMRDRNQSSRRGCNPPIHEVAAVQLLIRRFRVRFPGDPHL